MNPCRTEISLSFSVASACTYNLSMAISISCGERFLVHLFADFFLALGPRLLVRACRDGIIILQISVRIPRQKLGGKNGLWCFRLFLSLLSLSQDVKKGSWDEWDYKRRAVASSTADSVLLSTDDGEDPFTQIHFKFKSAVRTVRTYFTQTINLSLQVYSHHPGP
jgi:hypothetical protein